MRVRPWPLIILALIHLCAPVANVLWNAHLVNLKPWYFMVELWHKQSVFDNAVFYFLMPIAGVAIYAVKEWSYPVYFAAIGWATYANILAFKSSPQQYSAAATLTACLVNVVIVSYFLLPRVSAAYFNRFLRWWEISPRYLIDTTGVLVAVDRTTVQCHIENISSVGALVIADGFSTVGAKLQLKFQAINVAYQVPAQIVRVGEHGMGLSFAHTVTSAKQFRSLALALRDAGTPCPSRIRSRDDRLWVWFKRLIKTGQGFLPEWTK